MKKKFYIINFLALLVAHIACAQSVVFDTLGLKLINISHADSAIGSKQEKDNYQRLLGAVIIEHDGFTLTCDSAHFYPEKNTVTAYSNVNISKANGVNAHAEYMQYTAANNTAIMRNGVSIIDGNNTLNTEDLNYNIRTKIGKYTGGGSITSEETTISSDIGNYNGYSKQTYFKNNVYVSNPKYNIESKELTYNIQSKVLKILDQSTITTENSTIYARNGTYDTKTGNALFTTRTTVQTDEQTIIADRIQYNDQTGNATANGNAIVSDEKNEHILYAQKIDYNKKTGFGKATINVKVVSDSGKNIMYAGTAIYNKQAAYIEAIDNVVIIDTEQKSILKAGKVMFNENAKFALAIVYPKLITVNDNDSLYLRADTLINMRTRDKDKLKKININEGKKGEKPMWMYNLLYADSTFKSLPDEDESKIIIAHSIVKIYSDSIQAICDSLVYTQNDSSFTLYKKPILWSKNQQSDADTVWIKTFENKLKETQLKGNAFLLSLTGYEGYYDQVSGNYIYAYFDSSEIQKVFVNQNAESLYFGKDDDEEYLGSNRSESADMTIFFKEGKVSTLKLVQDPTQTFTPAHKLTNDTKFLKTFRIHTDKKPKNKWEILNDG